MTCFEVFDGSRCCDLSGMAVRPPQSGGVCIPTQSVGTIKMGKIPKGTRKVQFAALIDTLRLWHAISR